LRNTDLEELQSAIGPFVEYAALRNTDLEELPSAIGPFVEYAAACAG